MMMMKSASLIRKYRSEALTGLHDNMGHPGKARTKSIVQQRFYWPSICRIDQFTFVLNLSLKTGIVPDTWKLGTITPIPKSGALNDVNNIRPISLTALPGKLLERHVHTQLVSFLEENNLLCDFRKAVSGKISQLLRQYIT